MANKSIEALTGFLVHHHGDMVLPEDDEEFVPTDRFQVVTVVAEIDRQFVLCVSHAGGTASPISKPAFDVVQVIECLQHGDLRSYASLFRIPDVLVHL